MELKNMKGDLNELKNAHHSESCWIIGNGPSINQTDVLLLKNRNTFVANGFVLHKDFSELSPTYYVATNPTLMKSSFLTQNVLPRLAGTSTKVFLDISARDRITFPMDKVYFVHTTESPLIVDAEYNLDITRLLYGTRASVVIQAIIPIAVYMGFKQIFLVGCDCDYGSFTFGATHFYGDAKGNTNLIEIDHAAKQLYPKFYAEGEESAKLVTQFSNHEYAIVDNAVKKHGVNIYNCTIGGKLTVFPRMNLEDSIALTNR